MAYTNVNVNTGGKKPVKDGKVAWTQEQKEEQLRAMGITGTTRTPTPPKNETTGTSERDVNTGDTTRFSQPYSDVQGRVMPQTTDELNRVYSDSQNTRIGGKEGLVDEQAASQIITDENPFRTRDGISLPAAAVFENLRRRQIPGDIGVLNQPRMFSEGRTPEDWLDIGGSQRNANLALNAATPNTPLQDTVAGINTRYEPNFNPNVDRNLIVDALHTDPADLEQFARDRIGDWNKRQKFNPAMMASALESVQINSKIFHDYFNKRFSGEMQLKSQADLVEIQRMVLSKGYTPQTLTEFLYDKVAPAAELMEGNSPAGFSGAMFLSVLQHMYDTQRAANRQISLIDKMPQNQEEYNNLKPEEKHGLRGVYEEAFQGITNSEKGIGHLIGEATNMVLTGPEKALIGSIALNSVKEAFGPDFFVQSDLIAGLIAPPRSHLNSEGMNFVHNNSNLFQNLLNMKSKLPRVDEAGRKTLAESGVDFRGKGWSGVVRKYLSGQDFTREEDELWQQTVLHTLSDTPFTTLLAQANFFSLALGKNSMTGTYTPNAVTPLLDGKEYKHIMEGGEVDKRVTKKNRVNLATGKMEEVAYYSDTEKDTLLQINMQAALDYNGHQIRFDHFVGSNFRYYHEASVFNPTNHSARAFLGSGAFVNFETNNASHMMKIKAGIMTQVGLKAPGSTTAKLSDFSFQARAEAYDNMIEGFQAKYGSIVNSLEGMEQADIGAQVEAYLIKELQNKDSQESQAFEDLLNYGEEHDGYYTVNAIIEAIKLKRSIDRGDKVFRSNFMFEVDGTSNGIAINALFTANRDLLAATGITQFIMDPKYGFGDPDNIMSTGKPYEKVHSFISDELMQQALPALTSLLRIGQREGFITPGTAKGHLTVSIYGTGEEGNYKEARNNFMEVVTTNPEILRELESEGWSGGVEQIVNSLGEANWNAISFLIKDLQDYNNLQTKFMEELIRQYELPGSTLPEPVTVLDSGFIMRHGYPVSTIHGATMPDPFGSEGIRQQTNVIDVQGRQREKWSGFLKPYRAAITGAPVKMTHGTDGFMVGAVAMRSLAENPGAADGIEGGVLLQMYDGFFGSPMYAEWMDKTLNEEFLNLGYKVNNITALIDTAEKLGYDMTTAGIKPLIRAMRNKEKKGRKLLKNFKVLHGNQYAIGDGAVAVGRTLDKNEDKVTGLVFDNDNERLVPRSDTPKKFGLPPTGRVWKRGVKGKNGDKRSGKGLPDFSVFDQGILDQTK